MQIVSTIDPSVNVVDTIVPAKSAEPTRKNFGTVMKERHQSDADPKVKAGAQEAVKQDAVQEKNATVADAKQPETQVVDSHNTTEQVAVAGEAESKAKPELKIQQTVTRLMKVIAGGENSAAAEEFGSVEELLNRLVQQLEDADLKGEQVVAGIDLSSLVEQLQMISDEGGDEALGQFVEQLALQLDQAFQDDQELLVNSDLAGAALINEPTAKVGDAVAQARQILQQAFDAASAQTKGNEEVAVASTEAQPEELLLSGEAAEEIDPRFAGLLKPRADATQPQPGLRQQMQKEVAPSTESNGAGLVTAETLSETTETADFAELINPGSKGLENLTQEFHGQGHQVQASNGAAKVAPQTPMVPLPSGQQVAESQVLDQVVTHISGSHNGESGRMVLRLQPAELGSLKLELMVEGDRIKANLHAQTTQVQEVIERNLPQLRNALAEQGLKVDQFQVSVDQRQQGGQFENMFQQNQQQESSQQQNWSQDLEVEEQSIPLAHLIQNGGGGISLRV